MMQISSELLAISSEAAVLIKDGKLVFANSEARFLLGSDCVGKSVRSLFGDEVAETQAPSFVGAFNCGGKQYIIRVCSDEGIKALFISNSESEPSLISDAFIFSLRNYLMNLNLPLSLINDNENLPEDVREYFTQISHECFRINRILSNTSIIKSLWSSTPLFSPVELDITEHIGELISSVQICLKDLDFRFNSQGPIMVHADPAMLDSLMLNLISNSVIHGKNCHRLSISLSTSKNRVIISVDDDGCGIAMGDMHSVFDRFRHKYDMGSICNGPGMGLTAVRLIAAAHGGNLLLESREGCGTAVRVSLSLDPPPCNPLHQCGNYYEKSMDSILTGLADCLPVEMFSSKYID